MFSFVLRSECGDERMARPTDPQCIILSWNGAPPSWTQKWRTRSNGNLLLKLRLSWRFPWHGLCTRARVCVCMRVQARSPSVYGLVCSPCFWHLDGTRFKQFSWPPSIVVMPSPLTRVSECPTVINSGRHRAIHGNMGHVWAKVGGRKWGWTRKAKFTKEV